MRNTNRTDMNSGRSRWKCGNQRRKFTCVPAFGPAISDELLLNRKRLPFPVSLQKVNFSALVDCPRTTAELLQRSLGLSNIEQIGVYLLR